MCININITSKLGMYPTHEIIFYYKPPMLEILTLVIKACHMGESCLNKSDVNFLVIDDFIDFKF